MSDLLIRRTAVIDGACRYVLGRRWDARWPTAAWLLCNPSTADASLDDNTCRRMEHFTRRAGCGGFNAVNIWPLRATKPIDLWAMLKRGECDHEMDLRNRISIDLVAQMADVHFAAFGPEPARRDRARVVDLVGIFSRDGTRPMLCLGHSPEDWPLHPLARGHFAIPNTRKPRPWKLPMCSTQGGTDL